MRRVGIGGRKVGCLGRGEREVGGRREGRKEGKEKWIIEEGVFVKGWSERRMRVRCIINV